MGAPTKPSFWRSLWSLFLPRTWHEHPHLLAGIILVTGLSSSLLHDLAISTEIPGAPRWNAAADVVLLAMAIALAIVGAMYLWISWAVTVKIFATNTLGSLLLGTAFALTIVLSLLWLSGDMVAFRQTAAGVLSAAFIALAIQYRPEQAGFATDEEE